MVPASTCVRVTVRRIVDKQEFSDSQKLEIQVLEVNQPPIAARVPVQEVNLIRSQELRLQLRATDADVPRQRLAFQLKPSAPAGAKLDPDTGELTWSPDPQSSPGDLEIPFLVTDNAAEPLSSEGMVRLRLISPDPWTLAEQEVRECVYLLATRTKPGNLVLPLGTGCAISEQHLMTSATVASGIANASQRGWSVLAIDPQKFDLSDPEGIALGEPMSHAVFLRAAEIEDARERGLQQAFFDLAVVPAETSFPKPCRLGDIEASLKRGDPVGCLGFEIHGEPLTRFDRLQAAFAKGEVLDLIPPPQQSTIPGRPPMLLQIAGVLPTQPLGGVIINQQAEVLAIYAFQGELPPDLDSPPIHYAPESVHAKAFLADQGKGLWLPSQPIASQDPAGSAKR